MRGGTPDADVAEQDASGPWTVQPHDRAKQGRLAHPIASEQADGLMLVNAQAHPVQDGGARSGHIDVGDVEEAHEERPR